jgi:UPF0755 protein
MLDEDQAARQLGRYDVPDKPSRAVLIVVLAFIVLVAGIAFGVFQRYRWCQGAGDVHTPVTYAVKDGATGEQVVDDLAALHVLRCGGVFGQVLLHGNDKASDMLAGTYHLTTGMTFDQVLTALTTPPPKVATVAFTTPEGYTLSDMATAVHRDLHLSARGFLRITKGGDLTLAPYLPKGMPSAEGFLFPDTYQFVKKGLTPQDVVTKMLDQFSSEAAKIGLRAGAAALGYSPYQVVTIASMIEKEAKIEKDRPLIAAVIYNRLKAGMTLGIDATLLYDDPTPDGQLSSSDLKSHSPYNTRLHAGLPPTPIASPGLASLEAALHPADVNYLYYVLCGADGHHKFSSTYSQFLIDKANCLG